MTKYDVGVGEEFPLDAEMDPDEDDFCDGPNVVVLAGPFVSIGSLPCGHWMAWRAYRRAERYRRWRRYMRRRAAARRACREEDAAPETPDEPAYRAGESDEGARA